MVGTDLAELESLFLALNDKTRLRLLALMADGPVAVGFLASSLRESQPKVSRHLAYMRNAGVVYTKRDGKWIYYGIRYPEDASLRLILETVVRSLAAISEDNGYKFSGADTYTDEAFVAGDDIYVEPDMTDEISEIVGPIYEEMFYGGKKEEEMDVFLL